MVRRRSSVKLKKAEESTIEDYRMDIVLRAWPELLIRTQRLYKEATCRTDAAICQHCGGNPTTLPVQSVKFADEDLDHRSCVNREDALVRAGWDITTITCPLAAHITGCNVHLLPTLSWRSLQAS